MIVLLIPLTFASIPNAGAALLMYLNRILHAAQWTWSLKVNC